MAKTKRKVTITRDPLTGDFIAATPDRSAKEVDGAIVKNVIGKGTTQENALMALRTNLSVAAQRAELARQVEVIEVDW